ncbi:MAG: matrixin family metalloprotease [Armatimonadota bacterium]
MGIKKVGMIAAIGLIVASSFAGYHARAAIHPAVTEHLDNARIQSQLGKADEAASYAQAMLMGGQITVSVDYGNTPIKQIESCNIAIKGAFDMWETALNNDVSFKRVEFGEKADVKIKFDQNVKLNNQIVSGYINWSRSVESTVDGPVPRFKADVFLRTTDPNGTPLQAKAMKHTCGHEFGHMFGLDDVKEVGVLMGPINLRSPVSGPNESEVETVKAIRAECQSLVLAAKHGGSQGQCFHDH